MVLLSRLGQQMITAGSCGCVCIPATRLITAEMARRFVHVVVKNAESRKDLSLATGGPLFDWMARMAERNGQRLQISIALACLSHGNMEMLLPTLCLARGTLRARKVLPTTPCQQPQHDDVYWASPSPSAMAAHSLLA